MTEQAEYIYDLFISYSHADREWVWNKLLPRLEEAGLRVCIDERDFEIGLPTLTNMERAVSKSRHMLLVLTPAWVKSEWANFESLMAGTADPTGQHRKLIPLMLKPCKLPLRITPLTYVDFTRMPAYVDPFDRLLSQLQRLSAKTAKELREKGIELKGRAEELALEARRTAEELRERDQVVLEERKWRIEEAVAKGKAVAAKKKEELTAKLEEERRKAKS